MEVDTKPTGIAFVILRQAPDFGLRVYLSNKFDVSGQNRSVATILWRIAVQDENSHRTAFCSYRANFCWYRSKITV